jgi:hypothetical protein
MTIARCIALLLLFMVPPPTVRAAMSVEYADGRLTAQLENADLVEVLREVARQSGLEIRGMPAEAAPVSVTLDDEPLADALPRLLAGQSFMLTYGTTGLKGVKLLNGSDLTPWVIPAGVPGWTDPEPTEETGSLAASHRLVAIGGRLARAMGAEQTSFSEITAVALQSPDARVRADALRIALRILSDEPELQGDLVRTLDGFDDAALARWLERTAGEHAPEVARRAAKSAGSGPIRQRAAAVERILTAKP